MNIVSSLSPITFIDTNIWLYAFSESQPSIKSDSAKALLRKTAKITLSTQVVNEVAVNLLRKFGSDEQTISKLINSFYRKYQIIECSRTVLLRASGLRSDYYLSYWDSLIVASALEVGATFLYTEDIQDGLLILDQLRITNPFILNS